MANHRWTMPQIRTVAHLWGQNLSREQIADVIAERLGVVVSANSIGALAGDHRDLMPPKTPEMIAQLLKVKRRPGERSAPRPYTALDRSRMSKMWAEGATTDAIAKALGRSRGSIASFMSQNRALFPMRGRGFACQERAAA